jgi:hypothetical protein
MVRISRYLIEYIIWTFSRWHYDNQQQNIKNDIKDMKYIEKFALEKFKIVKDIDNIWFNNKEKIKKIKSSPECLEQGIIFLNKDMLNTPAHKNRYINSGLGFLIKKPQVNTNIGTAKIRVDFEMDCNNKVFQNWISSWGIGKKANKAGFIILRPMLIAEKSK